MKGYLLSLASLAFVRPGLTAPPSPHLHFNLTPMEIEAQCAAALDKVTLRLAELVAMPDDERNFTNTVRRLDLILDDLNSEVASPTFLKHVSTQKHVRDAGHSCETQVEKYFVDVFTRWDLHRAVQAAQAKGEDLHGPDRKLLEKTLLEFRRNGLELSPVERERVKVFKQQLVDLELEYGRNLNEVKEFLALTREDLEGLPEDYVKRLKKLENGRYKVTLNYPDYFPFMKNAERAEARRRLEALFYQRGYPENVALLEEAIRLRHRIARLLGYKTQAHYVLEERMAKDPKAVRGFLERLRTKLTKKAKPELKALLRLKDQDEPGAEGLLSYDYFYYNNQHKKAKYAIDDEKVKEYFPLETVTKGMLQVYQQILSLRFREVVPAEAWHPDVKHFEVRDATSGELRGHFYMDLFPRDGKYKHAAAFTLVGGRREPAGSYRTPVAAIVANFNKPTMEAPSLLKHDEVETYFHEFGHIMHQVLTRANHPRFAGTRVPRDFVEAPSQMFENWVWEPEVLQRLSGHYTNPSKKLPKDLLDRMVQAKNHNSGLRYLRQVFYATVDQTYHTSPEVDSAKVYRALFDKTTLVRLSPGAQPQASFGHLMGGYVASYYGYLWSEVYAADMFARFQKEGILNPEVGKAYRRLILEPGGGLDEAGQIRKFLGREPNKEAFLWSIGLKAP